MVALRAYTPYYLCIESVTRLPPQYMKKDNEIVVISVGGSLIVPDVVNTEFLQKLTRVLLSRAHEGMRFVIVTGGGQLSRSYQESARAMGVTDNEALDWIGIYATFVNAGLLKSLLGKDAITIIDKNPYLSDFKKAPILVAGGTKPGMSSDGAAVRMARLVNASKVVNLSNVRYVYDKDPNKFENATAFPSLTWDEFLTLVPPTWEPGMNAPFDPIAAREAKKEGIEVAVIHGRFLGDLELYLAGKPFTGTLLKN